MFMNECTHYMEQRARNKERSTSANNLFHKPLLNLLPSALRLRLLLVLLGPESFLPAASQNTRAKPSERWQSSNAEPTLESLEATVRVFAVASVAAATAAAVAAAATEEKKKKKKKKKKLRPRSMQNFAHDESWAEKRSICLT